METGVSLILISVTINAFTPVIFKYLYNFIDPLTILVFLGFTAFSLSVILFRPGKKTAGKVRRLSKLFLVTGVGGFGLNGVLYLVGLKLTTMSSAVLMIQSTYIFTIVFAFVFLKERVNRWEIAGMVLTAIGIALVAWNGMGLAEILRSENFVGNMMVFVSGLCWSIYVTGQKKILKKVKPTEALPVFLLMSTITSLCVVLVVGGKVEAGFFEPLPLGSIFFIALFGSVGAFLLGMEGLKRIKLITANVVGSMYPVMGIIFSVAFLSEALTIYQIMGAIGIIMGTLISSMKAEPVQRTK